MSFTAIRNAFVAVSEHKLSIPAKLVLFALANRHNQETGRCDPSNATIAKDMGISERAVRNSLRELEKAKLITTTHRTIRTGLGKRNMTNRYRLKGGAHRAGGMGHSVPTKQEYTPSAFDDIAMLIEAEDYD